MYSACGQLTKNKKRNIYQNKLDKTCFKYGMAHKDFNNLPRRSASDKVLHDEAFHIAKNPKYDGYERGLASVVYNSFYRKSPLLARAKTLANSASIGSVKSEIMSNQELAAELHKQIIRKLEKRKVHSSFIDNIWAADLADMQFIKKFNK